MYKLKPSPEALLFKNLVGGSIPSAEKGGGGGAHYDGDNKTIQKKSEKQFMSVIKLKPNLCTTYIEKRDGSFY